MKASLVAVLRSTSIFLGHRRTGESQQRRADSSEKLLVKLQIWLSHPNRRRVETGILCGGRRVFRKLAPKLFTHIRVLDYTLCRLARPSARPEGFGVTCCELAIRSARRVGRADNRDGRNGSCALGRGILSFSSDCPLFRGTPQGRTVPASSGGHRDSQCAVARVTAVSGCGAT